MNYVGLFEGISGFGLAFKRAGANIMAVCEIDKTCQSVLRRHHPEAEIISDVKTITKESFGQSTIDVLAGGFPCQDLSVAGLRKGLDGERSGLWFEFLRIITDHKPRIVVIENVPGLLSSNGGRDFAVILRGLVECGYGVCWRVFDSQFDGVAQRRNRVFIVASLRTASCAEVLFERDGSAWDSPPSREAGQGVTGTLNGRTSAGGGFGTDFECVGGLQPSFKRRGGFGWSQSDDVTGTLESEGGAHQGGPEKVPLIVASRECAQSLTANYGKQPDNSDTALGPNLAIAFAQNTRDELRYVNGDGDGQIVGALAAEPGMKQQSFVMAFDWQSGGSKGRLSCNKHKTSAIQSSQTPAVLGQFGVRRLTPTECERLQGFPGVENTAIIEICSDLLKRLANAENLNLKSLKPAGNAEKIESNQSAKCAELDLQPKRQLTKKPAQSDVLIYCDERAVEISSQEKSLWFASNAEKQSWFLPSIKPEDFAQLIVRICLIAGRITKPGEAELLLSEECSITQENGRPLVRLFGDEITQPASNAEEGSTTQNKPTKFTTSNPSSTENLERQLITSCYSVVSAITGFIPKRTQIENSFRIELKTRFGWTAFGDDGKPISDSARYRMLGNAVCVPTAEWIARRIATLINHW